jgi:hypothetical protein
MCITNRKKKKKKMEFFPKMLHITLNYYQKNDFKHYFVLLFLFNLTLNKKNFLFDTNKIQQIRRLMK